MNSSNFTGWIRYRISGRGGSDRDRWVFAPGTDEMSVDEIQDYITHTHEQWAAHADRVSFECWRGEVPAKEVIQRQIGAQQGQIEYLNSTLRTLHEQLSKS